MRGGYFLAEASPDSLMAQYASESLEEVFLKLSVIQNQGKRRRSSIAQGITSVIQVPSGVVNEAAIIDDEQGEISGEFGDNVSMGSRGGRISIASESATAIPELPPDEEIPTSFWDNFKVMRSNHMHALVWKNFLWMARNYAVVMFIMFLPMAQIILFCLSIGHDPKYLTISVNNEELDAGEMCKKSNACNSTRLSCNYLDYLEKIYFSVKYYDNLDEAKEQVELGNSWAAINFKANFSEGFRSRLDKGRSVLPEDVYASEVEVYQDISSTLIFIMETIAIY